MFRLQVKMVGLSTKKGKFFVEVIIDNLRPSFKTNSSKRCPELKSAGSKSKRSIQGMSNGEPSGMVSLGAFRIPSGADKFSDAVDTPDEEVIEDSFRFLFLAGT